MYQFSALWEKYVICDENSMSKVSAVQSNLPQRASIAGVAFNVSNCVPF